MARRPRMQRARIFVGCEGQSEMAYAGWLRALVLDRKLPFYFQLEDLGRGAGDPLTRIDLAVARINQAERYKEPFEARFLFLDTDQFVNERAREERARQRAREHDLTVIWQDPTHEALLLRHFPGQHTAQPPDARRAETALAREWPGYRKPMSARDIEGRIDLDGARRVAANLPGLAILLRLIELLEE